MVDSKQPRTVNSVRQFYQVAERWIRAGNLEPPNYSSKSRQRDSWLMSFWPREPHLAGVINSVVSLDKNRGWQIVGGRNQVKTFSQVFRFAEPTLFDDRGMPIDGKGWRYYFSQQATSFYTTDIGAITELGRDAGGPLRALWSVDPTRCELTGNPENSLRYYPSIGKAEDWDNSEYIRMTSMPSIDETLSGLGFCAVSRIVEIARLMVAIYTHDLEKLLAKMPKGLLLMQGILEKQWEDSMQANMERLTAKEREYYAGLSILFGDDTLDAKLVALSNLPDGFDIRVMTDLLMYTYALSFGYDPSEFWPVQFGSLGRGTEAEVQSLKASGKGGLDFVLAYQDNIQREIPSTLHFEFEQRNEQGEILEAQVSKQWAEAINEMAKPSSSTSLDTLTVSEKRQLLAQKGLIPEDWTVEEEQTVETDTGDTERERLLSSPPIGRFMEKNPGDKVYIYNFPSNTERVLFDPSEELGHSFLMKELIEYEAINLRQEIDDILGVSLSVVDRSQGSYNSAIRRLARALRRNSIDEFSFIDSMTFEIQKNLRDAWVAGAEKMGISESEIEQEEFVPVDKIINTEFTFLPGFSEWIVSVGEAGEPASALDTRIGQWAARWREVFQEALAFFGRNKKQLWRYDPAKENCVDCANLNGQVRRAKFWREKGLHPLSMKLNCGPGRHCGCELKDTDLPVTRGRLPRVVGPN